MPNKKVDDASEQELMEAEMNAATDSEELIAAAEAAAAQAEKEAEEDAAEASVAEEEPPAPKRRRSSKAAKEEEAAAEEPPAEEAPKPRRRRASKAENEETAAAEEPPAEAKKEKAPTADRRIQMLRRQAATEEERNNIASMASTWQALQTARRQNVVLEGHIFSIDRRMREDPDSHDAVAEAMVNVFVTGVYQEPLVPTNHRRVLRPDAQAASLSSSLLSQRIRVTIPFSEFYSVPPVNMRDIDLGTEEGRRYYIQRQEMMARKLIGLNIPFCITDIERDEGDGYTKTSYAIAGSRKKALPILSRRSFESIRGNEPLIQVGDIVEAKVLSVAAHTIQVTVAGVDTIVPNYLLTFRYIEDFRNVYPNGKDISLRLRVTDIRKREDGRYALTLNGRTLELERAKVEAPEAVGINSIVHGTFVQITPRDDGRCTAIAWLNDIEAPAYVNVFAPRTLGSTPIPGDEANLIVTGFHERGFVITNCSGTLGSPSRFLYSGIF